MQALFHASPVAAFCENALPVCAFLEDHNEAVAPLFLEYRIDGDVKRLRMLPIDGYVAEESYSLYAATVPAAHVRGELLEYAFWLRGRMLKSYTLPVLTSHDVQERASVPAVLPLSTPTVHYLASEDFAVRFVVLESEVSAATVWVLERNVYCAYSAQQGEDGVWQVNISPSSLERCGAKLSYYIEVTGGAYTVQYGNEKRPLSIRLVDNAGPRITACSLSKGEILPKGAREPIIVEYYDGSGVNLRTSAFCLDGRNLSQDAVWEQTRVSFTPPKAFSVGEHVLELTLRDKKGNRTYRRISFFVGEGKQAGEDAAAERKKAKPWHAAAFAAKAISTFKGLFSDKN